MIVLKLPKVMSKRVNRQLEKKRLMTNKRRKAAAARKRRRRKPSKTGVVRKAKTAGKCCSFTETPLGRLFVRECPVEWDLIQNTYGLQGNGTQLVGVIRNYALSSDNPIFRTREFQNALIDYERFGLRTPNKVRLHKSKEIEAIRNMIGDHNLSFGSDITDLLWV